MRTTIAMLLLTVAACGSAGAAGPASAAAPVASPGPAVIASAPAVAATPATEAKAPIQRHKNRMRWIEGPAAIKGSRMTTLEGNPKEAGSLYTIRITVPAGSRIAPHYHPNDERVTVLEGSIRVGFGDSADPAKSTLFEAGDFYVNPAGSHHFVSTDEAAMLQMTGIGPWEVIPLEP